MAPSTLSILQTQEGSARFSTKTAHMSQQKDHQVHVHTLITNISTLKQRSTGWETKRNCTGDLNRARSKCRRHSTYTYYLYTHVTPFLSSHLSHFATGLKDVFKCLLNWKIEMKWFFFHTLNWWGVTCFHVHEHKHVPIYRWDGWWRVAKDFLTSGSTCVLH